MKSTDGGASWTGPISQVFFHATNASGGGTILQPDLYELPEQIGAYPAGTILIAGYVFLFRALTHAVTDDHAVTLFPRTSPPPTSSSKLAVTEATPGNMSPLLSLPARQTLPTVPLAFGEQYAL